MYWKITLPGSYAEGETEAGLLMMLKDALRRDVCLRIEVCPNSKEADRLPDNKIDPDDAKSHLLPETE